METAWQRWLSIFEENSNSLCLRYRKRNHLQGERLPYEQITYEKFLTRCTNFGRGLRDFVGTDKNKRPFVPVLANNCAEWMIGAFGCFSQQYTLMAFPLSCDGSEVRSLLTTGNCEAIICDITMLPRLLEEKSILKKIVLIDFEALSGTQQEKSAEIGIEIRGFSELEQKGAGLDLEEICFEDDENVDTVMVTFSGGTTGVPKGIPWKSKQFIAGVMDMKAMKCDNFIILSSVTYSALIAFSLVTYSQGGTLTLFMGEQSWMLDDIRDCSPTTLFGVPSFWKVVYNLHQRRIESVGEEKANEETRASIGTNVKSVITGGASTAPQILTFLRDTFSDCKVDDVYGCTEAGVMMMNGIPLPIIEAKLVDVADLGYRVDDVPHSRGEVWVRGPGVPRSYFRRPKETAEKFKEHGWFATGDIAEFQSDTSRYNLIDRKSAVFKLSTGAFISPEKLESAYISLKIIQQIWITGSIHRPSLIAVVAIDETFLEDWKSESATLRADDLKSFLLSEFRRIADDHNFPEIEIPKGIIIAGEPFSVGAGLSCALKLHRNQLKKIYEQKLDGAYELVDRASTAVQDLFWEVLGSSNQEEKSSILISDIGSRLDMTWSEVGGDSLSAIAFIGALREHFSIELSPDELSNPNYTLKNIIELVLSKSKADFASVSDFEVAQSDLKFSISDKLKSLPPFSGGAQKSVFLTGATGFLGVFILDVLLKLTDLTAHCLVRAKSQQEAISRLEETRNKYLVTEDEDGKSQSSIAESDRIVVVVGDLSEHLLGLGEDQFQKLCQTVDSIIHCGAYVNFLCGYKTARSANVVGTQTILNIATTHSVKPVHNISSIAVLPGAVSGDDTTTITEDEPLDIEALKQFCQIRQGYLASKWVAEMIVRNARKDGLPAINYRPGLISAETITGASNPTDYLNRLVMGMISTGFGIDSLTRIDMTPVDYAARVIVRIFSQSLGGGETSLVKQLKSSSDLIFHVTNPNYTTHREISNYVKSFGHDIDVIPYDTWRLKLFASFPNDPLHPLFPLALQYKSPVLRPFGIVSCDNATNISQVDPPRITEKYFHRFLKYLAQNDYLVPKLDDISQDVSC